MRSGTAISRLLPLGMLALALTACRDREMPTGPTAAGAHPSYVFSSAAPVVNTLADDTTACTAESCTLRGALALVDSGGSITFSVSGTIVLDSALYITKFLTIDGPGASSLTISGNNQNRVFIVNTGAHALIEGVTIADGNNSYNGGGIFNEGNLTLLQTRVVNNSSASSGGAIYTLGSLSVMRSTVSGNSAAYGGGVYVDGGTLLVDHSTLSGNTAVGDGGAIWSYTNTDFITSTASVVNSTISGNTASYGGGITNQNGLLRIDHSTVTANEAVDYPGSGVWSYNDGATRTDVIASIIAGNLTQPDLASYTNQTPFHSHGYNIVGTAGDFVDFTSAFTDSTDTTGVTDPKLDTLKLNSPGTTATHALLAGSPAIDAGTCTNIDGGTVAYDQRDVARPQGSGCDIGSYELVVAPVFTSSCTYMINAKNDSRSATVTWANAVPGVIRVIVTDGRAVQKSMAPAADGSVTVRLRSGTPSYEITGGTSRRDTGTSLVAAGTACTLAP